MPDASATSSIAARMVSRVSRDGIAQSAAAGLPSTSAIRNCATRYQERGFATALPHFQYRSVAAKQQYAALNDATMVIVQFESAECIERADEIFAVEGVEMVLFGTNDMTADMGIPGDYEHPRVRDAYTRAIAAAKKHGKHVGVGGLASRPKLIAEFVKMGARYVSTGTDLAFLLSAATVRAKQIKEIKV